MRVTEHSVCLQVLRLFNESVIVAATPGEGPRSSVDSTRSTACALRWLSCHREDKLANPPAKPRLFPDSQGWGVIFMFVILFHRKIAMCGGLFSFFVNAHLVWAVMQEIWGANIWCEEGLKSPGGGGGGRGMGGEGGWGKRSFWQWLASVRGFNEECYGHHKSLKGHMHTEVKAWLVRGWGGNLPFLVVLPQCPFSPE